MVQLLWKTTWRFHKISNIELLYDPAIIFWNIQSKRIESRVSDTFGPLFIAALFLLAKR